jgi:ABC-type multidrug transport system permease subunit
VATIFGLARENGVLKRVRGTPLPAGIYLAGRIGGAVVIAVGALLLMVLVGVLAYDVQIIWRTALATTITVLLAITCFAALGLAAAALAPSAAVAQAASIGAAVVLGFVSDLFFVGQTQPGWLSRIASVFPLAHFVRALKAQFDPFASGAGWDPTALLVLAAWTVAAGLIGSRAFHWEPHVRRRAGKPGNAPLSAGLTDSTLDRPATVPGRPSLIRLLWDQVRWSNQTSWRDPGSVFFATIMPVLVYVISVVFYGSQFDFNGKPFGLVVASGMIAWAGAVLGFINLPESVLLARERGVLKRLRGTPLPPALYLAGRALSMVWWALLTAVLILTIGVVFLELQVSWSGLLPAALIVVLGVLTMAAAGLAIGSFLPSSKSATAVGLGILLPLAFFSGAFPIYGAPDWMHQIGSVLPLKPVVDGIATALSPESEPTNWAGLAITGSWLLGCGLLVLWRSRRNRES